MRYRLLCLDAGFTLLSPRRTLLELSALLLKTDARAPVEADV